jgi:quercetin dioxygenase-like cupin family protein
MDDVTGAVIHPDLNAIPLRTTEQPAYDQPFELQLLHQDRATGAEHYVVRYRPGTRARSHRHTAAHTIVVLDGHMTVDGQILGPGGYAHHPGGTTMLHEPAGDEGCTFVLIFDAPFDLHTTATPRRGSPTSRPTNGRWHPCRGET